MRALFRHLRSKSFPMVPRAHQFIEIWPFNSPSKVSKVHQDSLSQNGSCLGSVSFHSLTLPRTSLNSQECVVIPGLSLGPHSSNAFAFTPELPSFWLATLQPLALVTSPKLGLRHPHWGIKFLTIAPSSHKMFFIFVMNMILDQHIVINFHEFFFNMDLILNELDFFTLFI